MPEEAKEGGGKRKASETEAPKLPRVPLPVDGIQVNTCKTIGCENFGAEPLAEVSRGRVKAGDSRKADGFRVDAHNTVKGWKRLRCTKCGGQAERLMDLIRLDYCRMDLPDTLPGRVSMFSNGISFSCGLYYRMEDHEAYLIAGQVMQVARVGGIGLDCSNISILREVPDGETGNIARRGLGLFTQALEANYLSSKFAQCFVTLEFLASPDEYEQMKTAKTKIGALVARDQTAYHTFCGDIRHLSEDIRTKIVHGGASLEAIIPDKKERAKIFRKLQGFIGVTLLQMIENGHLSWNEFIALRDERLRNLGVK